MNRKTRRAQAKRGQSYELANRGRVIAVEDDVLGYKRLIETRWPELQVFYDQVDSEWTIVEHCADGVDRLVFSTRILGQETVDRIQRSDQSGTHYEDPIDINDRENAEVERDQDRRFSDQIGELGQRLKLALRKDGLFDHPNIYGGKR